MKTLKTRQRTSLNIYSFISLITLLLAPIITSNVYAQETHQYFTKSYDKNLDVTYFFNTTVVKDDGTGLHKRLAFTVGCQPKEAYSRGMGCGGFEITYIVNGDIKKDNDVFIVPLEVLLSDSYIDEDSSRGIVKLQYLFKEKLKEVKISKSSIIVNFDDRSYDIKLIK